MWPWQGKGDEQKLQSLCCIPLPTVSVCIKMHYKSRTHFEKLRLLQNLHFATKVWGYMIYVYIWCLPWCSKESTEWNPHLCTSQLKLLTSNFFGLGVEGLNISPRYNSWGKKSLIADLSPTPTLKIVDFAQFQTKRNHACTKECSAQDSKANPFPNFYHTKSVPLF